METDDQAAGKRSAWMTHVKKTMRANKGKPLSAVLKMAAKTYKKTAKVVKKKSRGLFDLYGGMTTSAAPGASSAAAVGGRRRSRRGGELKEDANGKVPFEPVPPRRYKGGRKTRKSNKNGLKLY